MRKNIAIFIGIIYVIFVIWNRLIRERFPRDIFVYNQIFITIYFIFLFLSLYLVIFYIRKILNIYPKYRILNYLLNFTIFEKIFRLGADLVINFILKGPKELYEFLYKRVKIRPLVDVMCKKVTIWGLNEKNYFLYSFLIFKYSFKFIILFVFCFDVFYLNYFLNFYKFLFLLLIPLIIDIILYIVFDLAKKNRKVIEEWLNFPVNDTKTGYNMQLKIENKDNPLLKITDEDYLLETMYFHYYNWFYYGYTNMTIDNFYNKEEKVKPYISIIIYSIYSIGWLWILFNLFLFIVF